MSITKKIGSVTNGAGTIYVGVGSDPDRVLLSSDNSVDSVAIGFCLTETLKLMKLLEKALNAIQPENLPIKKSKSKERRWVLKFSDCSHCPLHNETGGIAGEARWCRHPSFKEPKQICGKNYSLTFPKWCPLEKKPLPKKKERLEAWEVIVLYNDGSVEQHEQCGEMKRLLYETGRKYLTKMEAEDMAEGFNRSIPLNTGYKTRYLARFWYYPRQD